MKKITSFYLSLSLIVLLSLSACELIGFGSEENGGPAKADGALVGPTWRLVSFEDSTGTTPPPADQPYRVEFGENDSLRAVVDCNSCWGPYETFAGGSLAIRHQRMECTFVACGSESEEYAFAEGLADATSYSVREGQLRINYGDGQALNFKATEEE